MESENLGRSDAPDQDLPRGAKYRPAGTGNAPRLKQLFARIHNSGFYHHNVYDDIGIAESSARIFSRPPRIVLFVDVSGASDVCAKCVLWGLLRRGPWLNQFGVLFLHEDLANLFRHGIFSESFTLPYAIAVVSDCFRFRCRDRTGPYLLDSSKCAPVLARDSSGHVMSNPPVLWDIESDPALAGTKMIQKRGEQPGYIKAQELATCIWENSVACATQGVIRQTRVGGMLHFADMPTTCRLRDLTRDFIG